MKVYFEQSGFSQGCLTFSIYVKPKEDGSGIHYDANGKEYQFWWAKPEKSICVDSSELPKDLWYSFKHGVDCAYLPCEKKNNFTWTDLEYDKIDRKSVEAYKKVNKKIDDVKNLEEFKKLYPLIKKSKFINNKIIDKLFSFFNIPDFPVHNGEIGITFYKKVLVFKELLIKIGLEKEN